MIRITSGHTAATTLPCLHTTPPMPPKSKLAGSTQKAYNVPSWRISQYTSSSSSIFTSKRNSSSTASTSSPAYMPPQIQPSQFGIITGLHYEPLHQVWAKQGKPQDMGKDCSSKTSIQCLSSGSKPEKRTRSASSFSNTRKNIHKSLQSNSCSSLKGSPQTFRPRKRAKRIVLSSPDASEDEHHSNLPTVATPHSFSPNFLFYLIQTFVELYLNTFDHARPQLLHAYTLFSTLTLSTISRTALPDTILQGSQNILDKLSNLAPRFDFEVCPDDGALLALKYQEVPGGEEKCVRVVFNSVLRIFQKVWIKLEESEEKSVGGKMYKGRGDCKQEFLLCLNKAYRKGEQGQAQWPFLIQDHKMVLILEP
ncbi:hypothetical protein BXZ70DRAFT_671525 [Cristinia sonorae]|uniref:Uncharacterized protein n=1 Tax=Cristinia sonorae TaxID=1940300 RepID=A0A8K0UTC4_9AGAR|nr:hypothetical protein BXZ70DRAFT_671525 [Cristinia sonorae]